MTADLKPSAFANRDFRLLFIGSSVSALGDQFTLVALPWLVLRLTGDPTALGLVLAVMALPRAVFMLIGGAVVDRMSARRVLLAARAVNAVLVAILAVLVLTQAIQMWMLYSIAATIGLATAFTYPASTAILPKMLGPAQLQAANGALMSVRQLSLLVGPVIAGFVISGGVPRVAEAGRDFHGMGLAFSIDAISFWFSLASLMMIRIGDDHGKAPTGRGVFADIGEGLGAVWNDVQLRAFIFYVAAGSIFVGGPLQVGLPVLANSRMSLGAASLGLLMTANGAGTLLGGILSGRVGRAIGGKVGLMVLCMDSVVGLLVAAMSQAHSTATGAALLVVTGAFAGIVQISIFTWLQQRVPPAMMGRTMSILMFTFMGLAPISSALAGALLKFIPVGDLFVFAGLGLTAIALFCLTRPQLRSIEMAVPAANRA